MKSDVLHVTIAGDPVAQGRPRFSRYARIGKELQQLDHPRAVDDPKSREWKERAARKMRDVLCDRAGTMPAFPKGALGLEVLAVFRCPKTHERKRTPTPARWKVSTPDAENIAKAVQDAGKGVLWTEDAQVTRLIVSKVIGAQGEEPSVRLSVRLLTDAELPAFHPVEPI